jgi:hypothetical protein
MKNVCLLSAGILLVSISLFAHHGDAGRYEENVIVLTGTVVEVQLVDPHSIIVLDIPNEKGEMVRWQAELGGRNALAKNFGWNKSTLKFGDKLTITGRRVKSGAPYINLTEKANVVLTDTGKEIFRTPNYEAPKSKCERESFSLSFCTCSCGLDSPCACAVERDRISQGIEHRDG